MRTISIGFPSMKPKLTLWGGTGDEEKFVIRGITKKPYVWAYGVKYPLTSQEIRVMHQMMDTLGTLKGGE